MASKKQVQNLHKAIENGDYEVVQNILRSGGHKNAKELCEVEFDSNGTALHQAASVGDVRIVKLVLDTGIDINVIKTQGDISNGGTALHEAVSSLHEDTVRMLVDSNADVNSKDHDGLSPLHIACRHNNVDVVDCLVESGAQVNSQDNKGMTPLQVSIIRSSDYVALYLIDKDADVHIVDKEGQMPLHYATEWEAMEVIQALIGKGANVNAQDNDGNTPLHLANDEDVFDLLLKFGADMTKRNKRGKPAKEQRLDMERQEYKDINDALSRHSEKMGRKSHSAKVQDQQQPPSRIFSPGPPIPEAELKSARTNMLRELQKKTGFQGPAITLSDKSGSTTPKATAVTKISPLAGEAITNVTSQMSRTTIKTSK